jgi:hypothetical protein
LVWRIADNNNVRAAVRLYHFFQRESLAVNETPAVSGKMALGNRNRH